MGANTDVIVVGRGPAGLLMATLVVQHSGTVTIVADGQGTLPLWGGQWDFRNYADDGRPLVDPYQWWGDLLGGELAWRTRWSRVATLWHELGVLESPDIPNRNRWILSPLGHLRPTYLAPRWQWCQDQPGQFILIGFPGLADFSVQAMARVYEATSGVGVQAVHLPTPPGWRPHWTAINWAWYLDSRAGQEWLIGEVDRIIDASPTPLAFPQVLGVDGVEALRERLMQHLGRVVGEVALPPPSVGGLRITRRWERWLKHRGVQFVTGHVTGVTRDSAKLANGRQLSGSPVLASGGILGGGLYAEPAGNIRDPILGTIVGSLPQDRIGSVGHRQVRSTVPVIGRMVGGWDPDRHGDGGALTLWTVDEAFDAIWTGLGTTEAAPGVVRSQSLRVK